MQFIMLCIVGLIDQAGELGPKVSSHSCAALNSLREPGEL